MVDVATTAKDKLQEAGSACAQAANTAAEGVKSAASYVSDQARDMACNASNKAEDATSAIGGRLKAAGEAIRQNAPHEGRFGQASEAVAQTLSDTGEYLEREGLSGLGNDMTELIKRNPIPALLLGVGLGFLLARATTTRT